MTGLSERQLALRRTRITGHSAPALLGFSPYADPVRAWEEHTGRREVEQNDAMEAGNELEAALAAWAWKSLGVTDGVKPYMGWLKEHCGPSYQYVIQHFMPDWPDDEDVTLIHREQSAVFAATPDSLSLAERVGMQIKNHSPMMAKRYLGKPDGVKGWHNNLVPLEINMQCQWEMFVTQSIWPANLQEAYSAAGGMRGTDRQGRQWSWLLVSYFGGGDRRIYWIRQDRNLIGAMEKAAFRFWAAHLSHHQEPQPPTTWPWKAKPAKELRRVKLTPQELEAAPLPFGGGGFLEPFKAFGEEP